MTAKEKARDIFDKMEVDVNDYESKYPTYSNRQAKECSLICVDEIMKAIGWHDMDESNKDTFWDDVRDELVKM